MSGTGHVQASYSGAPDVRISRGNHNVGNHGNLGKNSSNGVVYDSGNVSRLKAVQHRSEVNGICQRNINCTSIFVTRLMPSVLQHKLQRIFEALLCLVPNLRSRRPNMMATVRFLYGAHLI